jgi:hypothetical protein
VSALTDLALQIALDEVKRGVFENANDNRGERVDEYQVAANSTVGQMWCAKFAWWCFEGNTWTGTVRRDGVYVTDKTRAEVCVFIRLG